MKIIWYKKSDIGMNNMNWESPPPTRLGLSDALHRRSAEWCWGWVGKSKGRLTLVSLGSGHSQWSVPGVLVVALEPRSLCVQP